MYICFIKHEENGKEFLFDCTDIYKNESLKHNDRVIVNTYNGEKPGYICTPPLYIEDGYNTTALKLISNVGAYHPIKKAIRKEPLMLSDLDRE